MRKLLISLFVLGSLSAFSQENQDDVMTPSENQDNSVMETQNDEMPPENQGIENGNCKAFIKKDAVAKRIIKRVLKENGWKTVSNEDQAEITVNSLTEGPFEGHPRSFADGTYKQVFFDIQKDGSQYFGVYAYSYTNPTSDIGRFKQLKTGLDNLLKENVKISKCK